MRPEDFDYKLPEHLIAQYPHKPRDGSRLMVAHRQSRSWDHVCFADLPRFTSDRDLLVLNDSEVLPIRLLTRKDTGGRVEILLLRCLQGNLWEALLKPGRRLRSGTRLMTDSTSLAVQVMDGAGSAIRQIRLDFQGNLQEILEEVGHSPLPPYIQRADALQDRGSYQTIYATKPGSVAAPTAGLHFTPELLSRLNHCKITLHVGYGTFQPIVTERAENHRMHPEFYEIPEESASLLRQHRRAGGKVIAVGTTTTRVLEHVRRKRGEVVADRGWTDLFVKPGFEFQVVNGLITNFHLPRTSLLMLVAAFAGKQLMEESYREAIARSYRFYSYGDAMFID